MINFIGRKKIFFIISSVIIIAGIIAFIAFGGLNLGLDFKGGTSIRMNIGQEFDDQEIKALVQDTAGVEALVKKAGADGKEADITTLEIDTETRDKVVDAVKEKYSLDQSALLEATNVSASASTKLILDALKALGWAILFMLIYITIRFSFKSGISAIIGLLHNILVMLAIYSIFQIPVNSSFVAAVLTVVGYSINDTIVVFDKIREAARKGGRSQFAEIANTSLNQTLTRTINTSVTTLITILTLYILGVDSIREFSLPIIIGVIVGTYSSICIATPIWTIIQDLKGNKKAVKRA
ncbi:MAG: protein translocase subunit SecF [Clostridia bacterium]|nr:protein translocase subunit SecF [Clostridia bacterium]